MRRPLPLRRPRRLLAAAALLLLAACSDHPAAPVDGGPPPGGPPPGGPVVTDPGTPTSFEKIEAAERAGAITSEQALLERLWAATGDARLAARFRDPDARTRGDTPAELTLVLREAAERLSSVSAATQRELVPYFQPPAYEGSAWTRPRGAAAASARLAAAEGTPGTPGPRPIPAEGWTYVDLPNLPVRIWRHPVHSARYRTWDGQPSTTHWNVEEADIATELQTSWPKLTALMGRTPLPDGGPHDFDLVDGTPTTWGDGGSPALDIYLVSPSDLGVMFTGGAATMTYPPGCSARPAFMMVSPWFPNRRKLGPLLAHELFHAIQFAFARQVACTDGWDESTATWASFYAYPRWEDGADTDLLLFSESSSIGSQSHGYYEWMFNAYLQHAHSPDLVRATYAAYAKAPTAMHALDAGLPGGLRRHMKEFARHSYNQDPAGRSFVGWEGVDRAPRPGDPPVRSLELAHGERAHDWDLNTPENKRSRAYRRYGVPRGGTTDRGTPGDTVRWIEIVNPHAGAAEASLQAFVKLRGGAWRHEDWSARGRITFCFAEAGQRVDSLVLMYSDHRLPVEGESEYLPLEKGTIEVRDACPQEPREYVVEARYWTTSEKLGIEYDVTYLARVVETEPGSGDLEGSGSYRGTIRRLYPANCEHMESGEWPKGDVAVSGALDATAFFAPRPGGGDWFGFTLATTDWTWMPIYERHAETEDEREAAAGMGTVTTGMDLLALVGGSVEETTVRGESTEFAKCAGLVTHHRRVSVTRMR